MRTGSRIHSFLPGLQGPFIRIKHAVKYCATDFQLVNMGKQALLSHARGKKHQKIIAVRSESQKGGTGGITFLFLGHQRRAGQSMYKRPPQEILIAPRAAILVLVPRILLYLRLPENP